MTKDVKQRGSSGASERGNARRREQSRDEREGEEREGTRVGDDPVLLFSVAYLVLGGIQQITL